MGRRIGYHHSAKGFASGKLVENVKRESTRGRDDRNGGCGVFGQNITYVRRRMSASWLLKRMRKLSRNWAANRRIGAADSFRLGEMELTANLPLFPKHQRRFLKGYHALILSQNLRDRTIR
jgi:hypothetical protein